MNGAEPDRIAGRADHAGARIEMESQSSFIAAVNVLLRRRRLAIGVPLITCGLGLVWGIIRGPDYTAKTTFAPNAQRVSASRLEGLAARFGFNVTGAGAGESVEFYAQLLQSRELLEGVAFTQYRFISSQTDDTLHGMLVDLFDVQEDTPQETRQEVVDILARSISVRTNQDAGLVVLQTTARWPELAEQIGRRMLELLNEFNLEKRQSQAAAERTFVEARVTQAQRELEAAEGELERFLTSNRRPQDSPRLQFEVARLQRRVELRQGVYVTLAQAYEEARIEEVRNTPVITVVDRPESSAKPGLGLLMFGAIGFLLGGALGIGTAFLAELVMRERKEQPELFAEFDALRKALFRLFSSGRSARPPAVPRG